MTKLDNSFQLKTRIPKDLAANIVHNFFWVILSSVSTWIQTIMIKALFSSPTCWYHEKIPLNVIIAMSDVSS